MTIQQVMETIRKGNIQPVYLALGTEEYLYQRFISELSAQLFSIGDSELNQASFDMEESNLALAVEEAESVPFFGDHRLVIIQQPFFLTTEKKANSIDHPIELLQNYLAQPVATTVLVIRAPYEKLDDRKKIVKLLKKASVLVDCSQMKEAEVRHYLKQTIQNEEYQVTPEAFELLLQLTEADISKVMQELSKLFLATAETKKITKPIVEALVPKSLEHNLFELVQHLLRKDATASIALYRDLVLQGEETIKINGLLISQIRTFLQVKLLLNRGYQQPNIVEVLKIHPYRVKLACQQVRSMDAAELSSLYIELVENDWRMKTGQMDRQLLFEFFLLKQSP